MLAARKQAPPCERCGSAFDVQCKVATVATVTWHVTCPQCRRAAVITEIPDDRRAEADK